MRCVAFVGAQQQIMQIINNPLTNCLISFEILFSGFAVYPSLEVLCKDILRTKSSTKLFAWCLPESEETFFVSSWIMKCISRSTNFSARGSSATSSHSRFSTKKKPETKNERNGEISKRCCIIETVVNSLGDVTKAKELQHSRICKRSSERVVKSFRAREVDVRVAFGFVSLVARLLRSLSGGPKM